MRWHPLPESLHSVEILHLLADIFLWEQSFIYPVILQLPTRLEGKGSQKGNESTNGVKILPV